MKKFIGNLAASIYKATEAELRENSSYKEWLDDDGELQLSMEDMDVEYMPQGYDGYSATLTISNSGIKDITIYSANRWDGEKGRGHNILCTNIAEAVKDRLEDKIADLVDSETDKERKRQMHEAIDDYYSFYGVSRRDFI